MVLVLLWLFAALVVFGFMALLVFAGYSIGFIRGVDHAQAWRPTGRHYTEADIDRMRAEVATYDFSRDERTER